MHEPGAPRRRRPPPVAGAAVDELEARASEIAKGWLLELIDLRPLEAVGAVPMESIAAQAPELCRAIARALRSDAELARLRPGGDLAALPARIANLVADDPADVARAIEALRGVTWTSLLARVPALEAERSGPLADRLASVCAAVSAAALAPHPSEVREPADLDRLRAEPRIRPGDTPAGAPLPAAMAGRIEESRAGALLLVEVDGASRLRDSEEPEVLSAALEGVAAAVEESLGAGEVVAHDDQARLWIATTDADAPRAHQLGDRIAAAVERSASLRDTPLTVSIGVAVHPGDGGDPAALAEAAEEAVFAARAAGRRVAGPPAGRG